MTTTAPAIQPARTAGLRAARQKDSHDKRQRALEAVAALEAAGTPVTFASVARSAGVSSWLVYADGVRERVDAARRRQSDQGVAPAPLSAPAKQPAAPASLRTDLGVARQEIKALRAERERLCQRLRLHLGAEIEGPDRAELIARVSDLESVNRQLVAQRDARSAQAATAERHVRELEDELAARAREPAASDQGQEPRTLMLSPVACPHGPHPTCLTCLTCLSPRKALRPGLFANPGEITAAVHLLEASVEVNVIRGWLGHADLTTTNRYAEINTRAKIEALRNTEPPGSSAGPRTHPAWRTDESLLNWLASL
jgi:hypothetical protein